MIICHNVYRMEVVEGNKTRRRIQWFRIRISCWFTITYEKQWKVQFQNDLDAKSMKLEVSIQKKGEIHLEPDNSLEDYSDSRFP